MNKLFNCKTYVTAGIVVTIISLLYISSPTKFHGWVYAILPFVFILACPISMIIMMKMMMRNKDNDKQSDVEKSVLYTCPICKLNYTDKIWAEKCKDWCEKHNSCNLEITSHALK